MDNDQNGIRPIDELNKLSANVDSVQELAELKPIFARVEEIAKQYAGATDIELAVKQVKTQLVNRGKRLKEAGAIGTINSQVRGTDSSPSLPPFPSPSSSRHEAETGPVIPIPTMPSGENPARNSGQSPVMNFPPAPSLKRPTGGVFAIPQQPIGPPPTSSGGLNWKRAMAIGAIIGILGAVAILVTIVNLARRRNNPAPPPNTGSAELNITTVPAGARIQINGEEKCVSPCKLQLPPGDYRVQAQLEGYDPTLSPHTLVAGQPPGEVTMTLTSQAQSLRIFSDIPGKILIDGKPQGEITEGSFILDRVPAGPHTVSVSAGGADASFAFDVTAGKAPEIKGATTAHNLLAVVVSNTGNAARLQASVGPLKTQLDGKDQPPIAATGTDFPNVPNGDHELIVGEGKDLKKIQVSFLPTPTLTAYLRSDVNAGTLVVVTNPPEDDVMVFVNGRALRKTSRGQLRAQLPPGNVSIRVGKDGFENVPDQAAIVKKGEDTRLEFKLKSLPRVATLRIRSVTSGATIYLDGHEIGKVNAEGGFQTGGLAPGDHEIEFRMAGFLNIKTTKPFKAGETVEVSNISLAKDLGIISLILSPSDTKVTYRHESEAERTAAGNNIINLVPGRYTVIGKAPGHKDKQVPITVSGGQTSTVDMTLLKDTPLVTTPSVRAGTIRDFGPAWTADGDQFTHAGSPTAFGVTPAVGTFHFKIQLLKGGGVLTKKIKWALGYTDGKNHTLFELEKNKFRHIVVVNGKQNKSSATDSPTSDVFDVMIEVMPGKVTTRINGVIVDQVPDAPNLTTGKLIFLIGDKDELGISGFTFTPAR